MVNLLATKSADSDYIFIPQSSTLKYTITITNTGDEIVNSITLIDKLSEYAHICPNTLIINGYKYGSMNISKELHLGSLTPQASIVISYLVYVDKKALPNSISNKSIITYFDSNGNKYFTETNENITPVINVDVCVSKRVDKAIACLHQTLNYYLIIRNNSNIPIYNVILYDSLINNVMLIPSSIIIGSTRSALTNLEGLSLGTIPAKSNLPINFQVKIISDYNNTIIYNCANVRFSYTVYDNNIYINSCGNSTSNKVSTKIIKERNY